MPWEIKQNYGGCSGYAVVKLPDNQIQGCHSSKDAANAQMRALYASEGEMGKQSPCWDGYVQRGMKPGKDGGMVPNCVPAKKVEDCCPDMIKMENLQEGMFVMGPGNEYTKEHSHGKIEHVMREGSLGTGSKYEIQATQDEPALLIRIYKQVENGWEETDLMTGFKASEATLVGTEQDMQEHSMEKDKSTTVTNENTPNKYPDGLSASANYSDMNKRSLEDLDLKPTESMASNARRGLELRRKFGRGGTGVGVARARDLSNRTNLSPDTVLRMYSFFSRHEVDKKGKDFNNAERPSNGKIAWLLWGGDSGYSWARSKRNAIMNIRAQKSLDPIWYDSAFSLRKYVDKNEDQ